MSVLAAAGLELVAACSTSASDEKGAGAGATDGGSDGAAMGHDGAAMDGSDGAATASDASPDSESSVRPCTGLPGGFESCSPGYLHRPSIGECISHPVPDAGNGSNDGGDEATVLADAGDADAAPTPLTGPCTTDADCTERPLGTCRTYTIAYPPQTVVRCEYDSDECVRDADCASTAICLCGTPNRCVSASSCRSDTDCAGGVCLVESNATLASACGGPIDEYMECGTLPPWPPPPPVCQTSAECGGGTCTNGQCVQQVICGRPFLVDGTERRATAILEGSWVDGVVLGPGAESLVLPEAARRALVDHWTEVALMEHASVAAFARFVLDLLSLGAPPTLIAEANAALADETAHARLCFTLATRYAGAPMGPGPLSMEGVASAAPRSGILRTAFLEACVGETCAALEAAEAAEHARDPQVVEALRRIAADEQRHAELGWRFLRWALATLPAHERRTLVGEFRAGVEGELNRRTAPSRAGEGELAGVLADHGVLGAEIRQTVRQAALREVVMPCLEVLGNESRGLVPDLRRERGGPGREPRML